MASRFGRLPANRCKFKLLPSGLKIKVSPEVLDYRRAYQSIFGTSAPDPSPDALAAAIQNSDKVTKDFYLFCLVNMWAHQQANPRKQFWAAMMVGQSGLNRFVTYQEDAVKTLGSLSRSNFGDYATIETLDQRLAKSETLAANWIIGYKTKNGGPAFQKLIEIHELDFDDKWLATTPDYEKFLLEWMEKRSGTDAQIKKRNSVLRTLGLLKKVRSDGATAFATRESVMPQVITSVLNSRGYQPETFLVKTEPWTCTLKFWSRIALAIQHISCLNYVRRESKVTGLERKAFLARG